jgi:hypothetical protein
MLLTVMESDKASRPLLVASWTWIGLDDVHEVWSGACGCDHVHDHYDGGHDHDEARLAFGWSSSCSAADDSEHRDASESMAQDAESRR